MTLATHPWLRFGIAILLPVVVTELQLLFWEAIRPFAWFLYFPTVFFAGWIGGFTAGVGATLLSAGLARWYFMAPPHTLHLATAMQGVNITIFILMGSLFSYFHHRLRQARRRLSDALRETQAANRKISELYEKSHELERQKSRFFANVSHELRTPLTLILGPVEKALAAGNLPDDLRYPLQVVERNARLLYRHVSDLLDVAKLEARALRPRFANIDLAQLVRLVASHFDVLADERQVRYRVDAPGTLPAQVDASMLKRIVLNLLSNAFKFTPEGGEIVVSLAGGDGIATLRVEDSGPGVPAHLRRVIFMPFRQGDGNSDRHYGGTGLGLAIVHDFVALHRGTVEVDERPGGGARFTARFSLSAPPGSEIRNAESVIDATVQKQIVDELAARPRAADSEGGESGPVILVVEDNADMREHIEQTLAVSYRVVTASDGRRGLELALALRPALIISDVMMPRMSGDALLREIRKHKELDQTPIIMLTARADDALRVDLLRDGAQDSLNKPFSADELRARARGLVARHEHAHASEALLGAIVESSEDAIISIRLDHTIASWNLGAQHLFGYPPEEVIGRDVKLLLPPEIRDEEAVLLDRLADGVPVRNYETRRLHKDGHEIPVWISLSPVRDLHGKVIAVSKIARDVSGWRDIEARLVRAKEQAELASRAKSQFVASMGHEIRTPMNATLGFAHLLLRTQLDAKQRDYVEKIMQASRTLTATLSDILDFSRIEVGRLTLDRIPFRLDEVIDAQIHRFSGLAGENGVVLACRVAADVPQSLLGDPVRIAQVLNSLLSNAVKFTHRGRIDVEVSAAADEGDAIMLSISVKDTGIGMAAADCAQVFEPFWQADGSTTRRHGGTGLGLSLGKRLVELMGGTISVNSRLGEGSEFTFTVRVNAPPPGLEAQVSTPVQLAWSGPGQVAEPAAPDDSLTEAAGPISAALRDKLADLKEALIRKQVKARVLAEQAAELAEGAAGAATFARVFRLTHNLRYPEALAELQALLADDDRKSP